jgi:nucleotide-binding universal stress UspA family protein
VSRKDDRSKVTPVHRQGAFIMYSKILVPLDGSKASEVVLPHVKALAEKFQAKVVLMSVASHPVIANYANDAMRWQLKNRDDVAERYLDTLAEGWRRSGLSVSTGVFEGHIADTILEQATQMQADLIAMATHGVSGVEGILMSGVAGRVLHHAQVPLLLVKSDRSEE